MLMFKDLTLENWSELEKLVLQSELVFKETIRSDNKDYIRVLSTKYPVAKVALLDEQYIGNIVGFCPSKDMIKDEGLKGIKEDLKLIYIFNFVIEPAYQHKGYGSCMLGEFIGSAMWKGYEKIAGHFGINSSLGLVKKFGAKEKKVYKNWCKTKEKYVLCELYLSHALS